jgi:glucose/mannose-6-phosphate isomerase
MLDDLKVIHHRDSQDLLGTVEKQAQQLAEPSLSLSEISKKLQITATDKPKQIVFAGMGGSALAGLFAQAWADPQMPFDIVRDYNVPSYVGSSALCILVSYSGGTEETISFFEQAQERGATVVVISHGGKLQQMAEQAGASFIMIPGTAQPRFATFYIVKAVVAILESLDLAQRGVAELESEQSWLADQASHWRPDVPTKDNTAKQMALELVGKSVVVGGGPKMSPAISSWKLAINENAKQVAWTSQYPEMNHNEFIGWTGQPVLKPYAVVELQSDLEHPQVQKRFTVSGRLLSGKRPAPVVVEAVGGTLLQQLLYTIVLGNFVSVYLALANGVDPAAGQIVDKLKKELTDEY